MFAYCNNSPVNDVDPSGHYGICVLNDPMNVNRAFMMPGMFGGGGGAGGCVAGVSSSYYASQNVKNYDRWWRNSGYNPNTTWSTGTISGFPGGNTGSGDSNGPGNAGVNAVPPKPDANNSKKFTPDQQAVLELAKENKNGLFYDDANLLVGWAREYGIYCHGPMIHSNRGGVFSGVLHIKIKNYHIVVFGGDV